MRQQRPRVVINCDGVGDKAHRPALIALFARDSDGTLLPIHSGVRSGGKELILPESGYRPVAGQWNWPCPNRRCSYRFRAPVERVAEALDRLLPAGGEASLRELEQELRHA